MKIILDTDKKTITVPWNYTVKLEEINRLVKEFGGELTVRNPNARVLKICKLAGLERMIRIEKKG